MRFSLALLASLALLVASANAEFTVWVSDKAPGANPVAAPLDLTLAAANSAGTLYIYGDGDTQLSGFALDLTLTGNAIKFVAPASVNNPAGRWNNVSTPDVTDSSVTNILGVLFSGASGVGGPVADEIPGIGFLLGQVGYMGLGNNNSNSSLLIEVNDGLFADFATGGDVQVRLGGPAVPACNGGDTACTGPGGTAQFLGGGGGDPAPVVTDFTDSTSILNEVVNATITATNNPTDWSDTLLNPQFTPLIPGKPGAFFDPTWNPLTQAFSWDTKGSSRGTYTWDVTASNTGGTGEGTITVVVTQVPEPATFAMVGLAVVGLVGFARRRS